MSKETFAIINDLDQVVNHIVVDKDTSDFEEVMTAQLAHWGCVRYVETTEEQPIIVLDESPTIWTTHTEETGFVLPVIPTVVSEPVKREKTKVNKSSLPADSLLLEENAKNRPEGWDLLDYVEVVED